MATSLIYMKSGELLKYKAVVVNVIRHEDARATIILNETIFYPQGGGQPFDQGVITTEEAHFDVEEVRFINGDVHHIGTFHKGEFTNEEVVSLIVDKQRRLLHNKLHTAGHLIDIALERIGEDLIPDKAYHFPDGPYVQYAGIIDQNKILDLQNQITDNIREMLSEELPVSVDFVTVDQLATLCRNIPKNLPQNKPIRIMTVKGHSAIPCGGTHVATLGQITEITIPKIKCKKGMTKISYRVN